MQFDSAAKKSVEEKLQKLKDEVASLLSLNDNLVYDIKHQNASVVELQELVKEEEFKNSMLKAHISKLTMEVVAITEHQKLTVVELQNKIEVDHFKIAQL